MHYKTTFLPWSYTMQTFLDNAEKKGFHLHLSRQGLVNLGIRLQSEMSLGIRFLRVTRSLIVGRQITSIFQNVVPTSCLLFYRVYKPSVARPVWLLTLRSKPVIGRIPSKTVMPKPRKRRWSLSSSLMSLCARKISWLVETAIALSEDSFAMVKKTAMTDQMKMLAVLLLIYMTIISWHLLWQEAMDNVEFFL